MTVLFRALIISLTLILSSCGGPEALVIETQEATLHSGLEILKIMEASKVMYRLDTLETAVHRMRDTLNTSWILQYTMTSDSSAEIKALELDDSDGDLLREAERLFRAGELSNAQERYRQLDARYPDHSYFKTMIGDAFFAAQEYDSSLSYFDRAIAMNPLDYHAHWFRGHVYLEQGELMKAYDEAMRAHVINPGNPRLFNFLRNVGRMAGRDYENWTFEPQFQLTQVKDGVQVKFDQDWMGYAFVKAVWHYEPGYIQLMTGLNPETYRISHLEEAEAVAALFVKDHPHQRLEAIMLAGDFQAFYFFEVLSYEYIDIYLKHLVGRMDEIMNYVYTYH